VIFVDTSFWYALVSPDDRRHGEARTLLERHGDGGLVTTDRVLEELWTLLRSRKAHHRTVAALDGIRASRTLSRVTLSDALLGTAWAWLRRHDERVYSFVDATSFAYMRHRRITQALALDGDFPAAGFVELRA